jgi:ferredoxin-NADP reductase
MTAVEQTEEVRQLTGHTITANVREAEFDVVITGRDDAVPGVAVLALRQQNHRMLPPWHPGAHVDVLVEGIGPRQYSLCGDPNERREWRIAVLLEQETRGGSKAIHESAQVGTALRIRGPRNHFALQPADRYLFIAGGIGITPLVPMIRQANHEGREWRLIYTGRSREAMALRDEVEAYGRRVAIWCSSELGRFDFASELRAPAERTLIYACGPESMIDTIETATEGWPTRSLHVERFTARALAEPVLHESFEIELQDSGITLSVPPDRSILQVVEEAGVPVLSSCSEGTCGTCETRVIEGVPEHRDSVLDRDERAANDCMMICVSRSCSKKLVLAL